MRSDSRYPLLPHLRKAVICLTACFVVLQHNVSLAYEFPGHVEAKALDGINAYAM
jgi:hypothetical protein